MADLFTFIDPAALPASPRRVVMHWTAGGHVSRLFDRNHYHACIDWDGSVRVVRGVPLANNMRKLEAGDPTFGVSADGYAAHTRGFNSFSIGYAISGMMGYTGPGDLGAFPMLPEQVDALITLCADTSVVYGLEVSAATFFTHYEAERLHGVPQRGKIDVTWIPEHPELGPDDCGPWLRERIRARLDVGPTNT